MAAFAARVLVVFLYPYVSGDYVYFLRHWLEHLAKNGYEHGWADGPWNYSMPYIYLLTGLARLTTRWLIGIKILSLVFDALMAFGAWRIVAAALPDGDRWRRWMAAAVVLLLPTFFTNSSLWGQCDAIYVSFILLSVDAIMRHRAVWGMVFFGIALAFKLQAVFLMPALLMLTYRRCIPWWSWLVVVGVYVASAFPAIVMGRGVLESLNPQYSTAVSNGNMVYAWVPDVWHFAGERYLGPRVLKGVMVFCGFITVMVAGWWAKRIDARRLEGWGIPLAMFVSAAVVPFFLTGMHERYFAVAAALGAILFVARPARLWPCLAPEVLLWPAYTFYLLGLNRFPNFAGAKWWYCGITVIYIFFLIWLLRTYIRDPFSPGSERE